MQQVSVALLKEFIDLFNGNKDGYGVHIYGKFTKGNKEENGKSYTKNEPLQDKEYEQHLLGKTGLGVSPIINNTLCSFGVIDVDVYNGNYNYIVEFIYKNNLSLFPFKSKSGGLHIYLFLNKLEKAKKVVNLLVKYCSLLGLPKDTEIFPKQTTVHDGIGNWINLPYYNYENTPSYLVKPDYTPALLREALTYINERINNLSYIEESMETLELSDAPPCLQHIYLRGDTNNRNEYLFSLARYYKTKYGDDFEFHLTTANNNLKNPIKVDELNKSIIQSHSKKEYSYKCTNDPLVSVCNKEICKKRKFGIGGDEISELNFEDFVQWQTDPPFYEWFINGKALRFTSEAEIIQQHKFRELCFRKLHILPMRLKDINWIKIVNGALKNVVIKDVNEEDDISPGALFKEYLTEFLEKRAMAANKEQILFDRVYKDDAIRSYVFKPKNLITFLLQQKQFRYYGQVEIQSKLRDLGGGPTRYYVSQDIKNTRVWTLPYNALNKFIEDKNIDDFEVDFLSEFTNEEAF